MHQNTQDPVYLLKTVLAEHLSWHGARITFLAHFLLALLKVRSVNLAELAAGFGKNRFPLQTVTAFFFRSFDLNHHELARLLVRLLPPVSG